MVHDPSDHHIKGTGMPDSIAIVGMAGRFPQAQNTNQFWQNVRDGVDCVRTFSDEELELSPSDRLRFQEDPNYVKKGAILDQADCFDAQFFGFYPKDVILMDPQHRLFLECSWHALEDAGYDPSRFEGRIGVFASCYMNTYFLANLETNPELVASLANTFHGGSLHSELGYDKDYLATRVAYKLNLRGPAITMQTACSSSLVAITQACQNLLTYQCDMALAGGVTLRFPQKRGYQYTPDGMVSPTGQCRTFDANAKGTILGNGVGVVLLKRLHNAVADGDAIYAIIKGWGLNNDGGSKYSFTAPSVDGQAEVIALAQSLADVTADTITYVEAHGTGTSLGDPIEIEALTKAFRLTTNKKQYCAIGSVKTNIGHLDCAAGVAGVIKSALALHHKQLPPSLHFHEPNPKIDFSNSPFYVNTNLREWPTSPIPRRAGVSSFGVGGTNAHVVLEEAPQHEQPRDTEKPYYLLPLSAKSETALKVMSSNLAEHLAQHADLSLEHVANTLQRGRTEFKHRRVVISRHRDETVALLAQTSRTPDLTGRVIGDHPSIIFMFPGQGAQHLNMGRDLYETELEFRKHIDQCSELLIPLLHFDIRQRLYSKHRDTNKQAVNDDSIESHSDMSINETLVAQPGIFITSYALAKLWIHWGIRPKAMIGHSIGEFVAACLGEVFSLEDALNIVVTRAKRMQALPSGSMLSIRLGEMDVRHYLQQYNMSQTVDLAVINSPTLCVVSGQTKCIQDLHRQLEQQQVMSSLLHTSHAFHSQMMEPAVQPFAQLLQSVSLKPTTIPIMSTVTAHWLSETQATDPEYWASHLREPVNFSGGFVGLLKDEPSIFLEVGPGQTLSTLAKQHMKKPTDYLILSSLPHAKQSRAQDQFLLTILGRLWIAGTQVNWAGLNGKSILKRVRLPGYPFEKKRFWVSQNSKIMAPDSSETLGSAPPTSPNFAAQIECGFSGTEQNSSAHDSSQEEHDHMISLLQRQVQIMKQQLDMWRIKP